MFPLASPSFVPTDFDRPNRLWQSRATTTYNRSFVKPQIRLSEESLFGYLTSTGLPVVSSLSALIRWISAGLGAACALMAAAALTFFDDGFWSAFVPWSGALPSLVAAPIFLLAWRNWRDRRLQRAATWLFMALFTLSILANLPRGSQSASWYLHPVLSMLATICLGVIPGLTLTLVAVTALLLAGLHDAGAGLPSALVADHWVHVTSLAAVTLASALAGSIVNRLLFMTLMTAEAQRRKSLESSRALRYREKLLRHALRVETIGDLAGLVCHQLRNTFQVLLGHVTMGEIADDRERIRRLALIEETVQQTKPLLDELMVLAHPGEGSPASTRVNEVLRQFESQARLVLPATIRLVAEIRDDLPAVIIDPRGLVHALWNLVINARQAIAKEGQITLRCGAADATVWIEVEDNGSGIPAEVRERIFDPYFTTKPAGQGTGLGLTAVSRFVRGWRGSIHVTSEIDRGSTFRLSFPAAVDSGGRDPVSRSA